MRFGRWYPLAEASAHAPAEPGVFQVRVRSGPVDYPTGKSAMIHYGASLDLRTAVTAFAAQHPGTDWLCRHTIELTDAGRAHPAQLCDQLLSRFSRQFGSRPRLPKSLP
jgi:hypothetical protein